MFLEIRGIKKHFGEGESRVEVLKGIDAEIEKGEICVLLGLPVRESPHCSTLSAVSTAQTADIFR